MHLIFQIIIFGSVIFMVCFYAIQLGELFCDLINGEIKTKKEFLTNLVPFYSFIKKLKNAYDKLQ